MVKKEYNFNAKVINVVDGDTIDVVIDLGFYMSTEQRLRLNGIDTMETNDSDPVKKAKGLEAKQFVKDTILGKDVVIHTFKADKYGRFLANVYFEDMWINDTLVSKGLAVPYFGGAKA